MRVKTPGSKGGKIDSQQSISRGKQDARYHTVTKELDLPIRLLVLRDGRPAHQLVRNLVNKALAKVKGGVTNDLSKAVHTWSGKVIAYYKHITLKEMKVFLNGANKADLFGEFEPGSDEKRQIFTALWDNYHSQNAEKVFLWVARFVDFQEPLSSDGIIPTGSFWVKTFFVNLAVKTKLYLDAPKDPDSSWSDLQAFFDAFPQKHPYYPKVHISDFKMREDPKTIRHSQYLYGSPTSDDESAPVAAPATVDSCVRTVVREPVSSARQKGNKGRMSSKSHSSLREMSSSSTIKSEEEVCSSSSRAGEVDVPFHGRINQIEEGSFLDNVTITDYVIKSDTFQNLLLFAKS